MSEADVAARLARLTQLRSADGSDWWAALHWAAMRLPGGRVAERFFDRLRLLPLSHHHRFPAYEQVRRGTRVPTGVATQRGSGSWSPSDTVPSRMSPPLAVYSRPTGLSHPMLLCPQHPCRRAPLPDMLPGCRLGAEARPARGLLRPPRAAPRGAVQRRVAAAAGRAARGVRPGRAAAAGGQGRGICVEREGGPPGKVRVRGFKSVLGGERRGSRRSCSASLCELG